MRTYGYFCAMARALDVVGDRWSLLVIRELWLSPQRFGALSQALPGLASNLLTERLRNLEAHGVVARGEEQRSLYCLTARGEALAPVMAELIRWGEPQMAPGESGDVHENKWFAQAIEALVPPAAVTADFVIALALDGSGAPALLEAQSGVGVRVLRGPGAAAAEPAAQVTGEAEDLVAVLAGRGSVDSLHVVGEARVRRAFRALVARSARLRELPSG